MNENGKKFKHELEALCAKYNVSIFAGTFGIKFDFRNKKDIENSFGYFQQDRKTKMLIKVDR